jgi:hypothetical protein
MYFLKLTISSGDLRLLTKNPLIRLVTYDFTCSIPDVEISLTSESYDNVAYITVVRVTAVPHEEKHSEY